MPELPEVELTLRRLERDAREEWAIENQAALAERCRVLESDGGTAAELLYGVLPPQETHPSCTA